MSLFMRGSKNVTFYAWVGATINIIIIFWQILVFIDLWIEFMYLLSVCQQDTSSLQTGYWKLFSDSMSLNVCCH